MADSEIRVTVPFAQIPEWVLDDKQGGFSAVAVRLYGILQRYGNSPGAVKVPGRATLAGRVGCSLKSLDRAKAELERGGALRVDTRPGLTNSYVLNTGPTSVKNDPSAHELASVKNDVGGASETTHDREQSTDRTVEADASTALVSQNEYVGFFASESQRVVGVAPVAAAKARLGRDCKKFAAEGIADVVLRAAITELVQAGLGVGSFGGLVDQFHRGGYNGRTNGTKRYGRGMTTRQILDAIGEP